MSQDNLAALHPPPDVLRDFNLGRLADEEAVAVGAHLDVCASCCQMLRDLPTHDGFVERLRSSSAPADAEVPVSLRRLGDYHLIREIGRGGMGVVYEAEQRSLGRRVALKVLPARILTRATALERFRRESRLAARLHHTNIVPVFEVGQEGDVCFYAMQLIDGRSLDRLARLQTAGSSAGSDGTDRFGVNDPGTEPELSEAIPPGGLVAPQSGDRLRPDEVARLGHQVAQALAYAHERGVLHRDVKPSNLLLDESGTVWVTDFGLAKAEDDGLTGTADLLGTLRYMAPERFKGLCDARANVYGLGCTLYELLTRRAAFGAADPAEVVEQVRRGEPARPRSLCPDVPVDLEAVVLKAMDPDPARRYPTAAGMAEDLRRFLDGQPTRARPTGPVVRLLRWARRHPAIAALVGTVAASLLAGIAFSTYFARQADEEARAAREARNLAVESENAARRQSANLLFDRGLPLAQQGKMAEGLHWMLAALEVSPDPDFQTLVRTHLRGWAGRTPVLRHWLDTRHDQVALSPDGTRAATVGAFGAGTIVQFWDLQSGEPAGQPLPTGDASISEPSYSPDGSRLLTLSGPGAKGQPGWATLWDVTGRRALARLEGHRGPVRGAAWSYDGRKLLTFADDGTARVWSAADGKPLGVPITHPGTPGAAAFSRDGEVVVIVSPNGTGVGGIATGRRLGEMLSAPPVRTSAGVSPTGQFLLLGYPNGERKQVAAYRWNLRPPPPGGRPTISTYPTDRPAFLADGSVAPHEPARVAGDGRRFVSADGGLRVWDSPRGLSRPPDDLLGLSGRGSVPALFNACAISADRRRVWTSGKGGLAQQWDAATGRPVGVPLPDHFAGNRGRMATTPDGRLIAIVPPSLQRERPPVCVCEEGTGSAVGPALPQPTSVLVMAFSPDGRLLATGGHPPAADLWDVATGRRAVHSLVHPEPILDFAFSPDGGTLAVATAGEVRLWDARTGQLRLLLPHPDAVRRVVYSPDGTRLLTLCSGAARLWDPRTGEPCGDPMPSAPLREARDDRLKALFSDDGKVLLVCGGDGSFRFWDAATGNALGPPILPGGSPPSCFAFSPNGRLAVSGHPDNAARLWDVASARPVGTPVMQAADVIGVAFRTDGHSFLTVGADGSVRPWPVPQPADGDVVRLTRALRLTTGLRLDAGQSVAPLARAEWDEERRRWREAEGDANWGLGETAPEEDWHDARARDAEQLGATFTAWWHLKRLAALRPGDWLVAARRGAALTEDDRWDLAEAEYRRAQELGAGDGMTEWYWHRARVCQARRLYTAALGYFNRVAERRPEDWRVYVQRADVHAQRKDAVALEADVGKAIALGADAPTLMMLGHAAGTRKQWQRAADLFGLAARSEPLPVEVAHLRALACLQTGDVAAYRQLCEAALRAAGREKPSPFEANAVARICALGSDAVSDYGPALELARTAVEKAGTGPEKHQRLNTLGELLYRRGRFDESAATLAEGLKASGGDGVPRAGLILAITHHCLGRPAEAREWLARAQKPQPTRTNPWDELEMDQLRREAEALLARPAPR